MRCITVTMNSPLVSLVHARTAPHRTAPHHITPYQELNAVRPQLSKEGIGLVAIGFERVGLEDFVATKVWNEDALFVDSDGSKREGGIYDMLGTQRGSLFQLLRPGVFAANSRVSKDGTLGGDMTTGDGLQLGGVFIFNGDGKVVFHHVQKNFTDHPSPEEVVKAAIEAKATR